MKFTEQQLEKIIVFFSPFLKEFNLLEDDLVEVAMVGVSGENLLAYLTLSEENESKLSIFRDDLDLDDDDALVKNCDVSLDQISTLALKDYLV